MENNFELIVQIDQKKAIVEIVTSYVFQYIIQFKLNFNSYEEN